MISIGLGTEGVPEKKNQNSCPHEASIYQNKILYLDLALREKKNSSSYWKQQWIPGLRFKNQFLKVGGAGP